MSLGTALITGASTGIGAIYASRLASRGYDLLLVARDGARLDQVACGLRDHNIRIDTMSADLTNPADLLRVESLLRTDAAITMLINNAGMSGGGPTYSANPDVLQSIIDLNVLAFTRLAAAAAASFSARVKGTIVNIASVTALFPEKLAPTYPATKAYVIAFSQALAAELSSMGVRVQIVLPGATRTEIWARSGADVNDLPPEIVMSAEDLVDAALAGLDQGEVVTIPSLPELDGWQAMESARLELYPGLSRDRPAQRYTKFLAQA